MSQSITATGASVPGVKIMLSSLKSEWIRLGGASAGTLRRSQSITSDNARGFINIGDGSAASRPTLDGSGEDSRRTADTIQANLRRVYGMQSGEALDYLAGQEVRRPPAGRPSPAAECHG